MFGFIFFFHLMESHVLFCKWHALNNSFLFYLSIWDVWPDALCYWWLRIIAVHLTNKWPQSLHLMHLLGVFAPAPRRHTWFSQLRSLCSVCSCWRPLKEFSYIFFMLFFFLNHCFSLQCLSILVISRSFQSRFHFIFLLERSYELQLAWWRCSASFMNWKRDCSSLCVWLYINSMFFFFHHNKIWFNLQQ